MIVSLLRFSLSRARVHFSFGLGRTYYFPLEGLDILFEVPEFLEGVVEGGDGAHPLRGLLVELGRLHLQRPRLLLDHLLRLKRLSSEKKQKTRGKEKEDGPTEMNERVSRAALCVEGNGSVLSFRESPTRA